jgi:AcrR family transcriptional regulator
VYSVVVGAAEQPSARRGPRPRYTPSKVVEAATAILTEEGLEGFSLRALSRRLGLTPMALYGYFADKDDLIDAVIAARLAPLIHESPSDQPWDEELEVTIREMYLVLCETPAIAELAATRRPGPRLDPFRRRLFAIAERGGLGEPHRGHALRALTSYVFGAALVAPPRSHAGAVPASRGAFDFGLAALIDAARHHAPTDTTQGESR